MFQATTDSIGGASVTSDLTFEAGPPGKIEVFPKTSHLPVGQSRSSWNPIVYSGRVLCWASDAWPKQKGLQSHHSNYWWGIPKFFVHSVLYGFHYKNTIYMNWRIICCYFGRYNQRCSFNRLVLAWCQKYVLVDVSICSSSTATRVHQCSLVVSLSYSLSLIKMKEFWFYDLLDFVSDKIHQGAWLMPYPTTCMLGGKCDILTYKGSATGVTKALLGHSLWAWKIHRP